MEPEFVFARVLSARIQTLAHRHRRCGVGMIYLKLRQAGESVIHAEASIGHG